jgi:parallel beta-helix repeat protein
MKRASSILLALALVLGFSLLTAMPVAAATTWYVDDDNCPGPGSGSVGDPFCAIQAAVSAASSGDTIYVRSGTYYEHVVVDKQLTLQGEDRERTIIDGSGSGDAVHIAANYVTLESLTVTNGLNGIHLPDSVYYGHLTLRNLIIDSNANYAISDTHTGGYWLIEDCIISNNGGGGLVQAHQSNYFVIRNCQIFGNGGAALDLGWGNYVVVEDNSIHHNAFGIDFDSMWYSVISGNILYANGDWGIIIRYQAYYNTVRDNVIYENGQGIYINWTGSGNRIYHNDFIGNTIQAQDTYSVGIWDDGYPSGGNYWSDYAGTDSFSGAAQNVPGSDGIGDTPYTFSGKQDNYPLMEADDIGCVTTATGTGMACFITSDGVIEDLTAVTAPPGAPVLPHGLFSFRVTGLTPGQNVTITILLPDPVPVGTKWWKYQNGSWYSLDISSDDGDNIIMVTFQDGGEGDEDGVSEQVTDDGGPGAGAVGWETHPVNKARVLLPWIALAVILAGGTGWYAVRRRTARS